MTYALGARSLAKLEGVNPRMVAIVKRAIQLTAQDFVVLEGVRTQARQRVLYAQGRTRPGPKVTWTLTSRHFVQADGFGHAVDICPWPVDWNTPSKFDAIADAMEGAALELDIGIRWGANWDGDGVRREAKETDSPHFELDS